MKCLLLVVVWGIENNKLPNSKPHGPVKCCFPAEIILQKKSLKHQFPSLLWTPLHQQLLPVLGFQCVSSVVPVLWEECRLRVLAPGNVWLDQPVANTLGSLAKVGVRSLILIYLEVAV